MEPITEPHTSPCNLNYAFITHSQETLPRNFPPTIDNATLARRRRRRTSAHDQAILEEEYRKCDRPDKAKRREITDKVQMGEKEVQIWFQNKRQSARRKAKPLLPHEIIPNSSQQYSSFDNSQSFSSSQSRAQTSFNSDVCRRASVSSDCHSPPLADSFSSDVSASQGSGAFSDADDEEIDTHQSHHYHHRCGPSRSKRQKLSHTLSHSPPTSSPRQENGSLEQSQASLTSNYDLPEPVMTTSAHQRLQDVLSSSTLSQPAKSTSSRRTNPTNPHQPPRLLKRSSSIRLSTSLEGKAMVVLEEPSSPPPSQLLSTPKAIPSSVAHSSGPKRRIVDSKIWEFYCDNQAMIRSPGQANMQPAEAKQALGLLRKKGNAKSKLPSRKTIDSPIAKNIENNHHKLIHSSPTKAKKSRKIISQKSSRPKPVSATPKKSHVSSKKLVNHNSFPLELSQESDKENRPPGAPVSPPPEPRRCVGVPGKGEVGGAKKSADRPQRKKKRHIRDSRKILENNKSIPSHSTSASMFYDPPSSSQYLGEVEDEPEVEVQEDEIVDNSQQSFYMESSQNTIISRLPPARMDEMECVENLLSLRGGTWK